MPVRRPSLAHQKEPARSERRASMIMLGCDKNRVDGERMLGELHAGGFALGQAPGRKLDLLIVNTCSFIGPAREESLAAIREAIALKGSGGVDKIAVAGCFTPLLHRPPTSGVDVLDGLREGIDFFIGPGDIDRALQIVTGREEAHFRPPARSLKPGPRFLSGTPGTAFVKIAEGCNKGCSFCTIPSFRGKFVSRDAALVLDEVRALAGVGVREMVFVAQDTANYGRDGGSTLAALVRSLDQVAGEFEPNAFRVRLHYLYPSQVTDDLIDAVAESPVVTPYWDVPIQHAAASVLKAMSRPSNPAALATLMEKLRRRFSEGAIRTTIITGHPGETKHAYNELIRFISDHEFDRLGVFPFIPEPGTPAATMKQVAGAEERATEVMALQAVISAKRLRRRVGSEYDVIMDTPREGRSALEAPDVDGVIHLDQPQTPGRMVRVRITGSDTHDLQGTLVLTSVRGPRRAGERIRKEECVRNEAVIA